MAFVKKALLILSAAQASLSAHTGVGVTDGFSAGFMHPFSGYDHILAMFAVGLWAAQTGGLAIWAVPSAFVGMMLAGAGLGAAGVGMPFVETGIVVSVVVLGLLVAGRVKTPLAAGMAIAGVFALFHGYAHGAEMPVSVGGVSYMAGFAAATVLLHAAGIVSGSALGSIGTDRAVRAGGGAIAAGGLLLALA